MMNTQETIAAIGALSYPRQDLDLDRDERLVLHRVYNENVAKITGQFQEWLANEYASQLPADVQARIWSKAWEEGHSSGYSDVENYYIDNAEFATFVFNAAR